MAMKRLLAAILAIVFAVNALAELFAGRWWYGVVPGVVSTGPYNAHFIQDIGATYLAAALGFAWFAVRPRAAWPALVTACAFLTLHGLIHLAGLIASPNVPADLVRDFPGVYLPALIAIGLAVFSTPKEPPNAESPAEPRHR
jgi:hypothetical protein